MTTLAPKAYLNGRFVPQAEAHVPITDRGLLFGDSVYEVIPAYGGRLFRASQHIARLDRSLAAIRMTNPLDHSEWFAVLEELVRQLDGADQYVYVQVTRGAYAGRSHVIPAEVSPNVFAFASLLPQPDPRVAAGGVSAVTLDDIRWMRCDIKATTLLANVLGHSQARDEGADEAIFVRDGKVIEGTASNLFIVNSGLLITPPNSQWLLPGVTRDLVLELAQQAGLPYAEASISMLDLDFAEEVWLTSSTREVMPVTQLNGRAVGGGRPGPYWQQMRELYGACKEMLRAGGECRT
ncbi:MAG: D-amino acid aminotransferase [Gammaproteobacteria bacterium]|jgi:D-alanine transaminase